MKQRPGAKALPSRGPMKLDAYERALLIYLPALVLLVAFVAVCVQAGTPWPWTRVVHEDGQHTFLGTIFYFEHATRELLLDAALALAAAGAVRYFYPPSQTSGDHELARMRIMLGAAVAAALALILGGTAYRQCVRAVLLGRGARSGDPRQSRPISDAARGAFRLGRALALPSDRAVHRDPSRVRRGRAPLAS